MAASSSLDHYVQGYGDLIFDLCESVLWSSTGAQLAFRAIMRDLKRVSKKNRFHVHERAWVLKLACDRIRSLSHRLARRVSLTEQLRLDSSGDVTNRLKHFEVYFHRLTVEDQILLLLKDKHSVPYSDLAPALGVPEGTLRMRRQLALKLLEEWLWDNA